MSGVAHSVDPAPANSGHHVIVPIHGGLAGALFEDAHPQLGLASVIHPQLRVELLGSFKGVGFNFAHKFIAFFANSTRAAALFDQNRLCILMLSFFNVGSMFVLFQGLSEGIKYGCHSPMLLEFKQTLSYTLCEVMKYGSHT